MIVRFGWLPLVPLVLLLGACGGGGSDPGAAGPPAAPSDVRAVPGPGYMTITWQDNSDDETGFVIHRDDGTTAGVRAAAEVGTVGANTQQYVDMEAEVGTPYTYRPVAFNEHGASADPTPSADVRIEPGVDLLVGTNDRTGDRLGTVFIVYFVLPAAVLDDPGVDFDVALTGPDGWNGGDAYEWVELASGSSRQVGFDITSATSTEPVAGTYEVSVTVGPDVYTDTATLPDLDFELGPPTNITITDASASAVTVTWDPPAGAESAWVSLWRGDYEEQLIALATDDTTYTFEDLSLEDGAYLVEVTPVNTNIARYPLRVEPFGISYESQSFEIGDAVTASCSSPTESVDIADTALATAIRDELELADGDITCEDMARLAFLDAEESGIASLEGMQSATNLTDLRVGANEISDLAPLTNLHQLEHLDLNENMVSDLVPLQDLTSLRELHLCCEGNTFPDLDPLANLTALEELNIGGHELGDADVAILSHLHELRQLFAWDNAIADGSVFTTLEELTHLHLSSNEINDLSFLEQLPNLTYLVLDYNDEDLDPSPLFAHTQLVELGIQGLGIVDIEFLSDFVALELLHLTGNDIVDIAPLVANAGLGDGDEVWVDENLLDLSTDSPAMAAIAELEGRGVDVEYEPQRTE